MDTKTLIEKLTKALLFKFSKDKMAPGITIAILNNNEYYVSLIRFCPAKTVLHKFQHQDLDVALIEVGRLLIGPDKDINPLDQLSDALKPLPKLNERREDDLARYFKYLETLKY